MTTARAPIRERILDTSESLVLKQGFSATTLEQILSGAKASKGAFFHHFPSKEALGDALLSRYHERDIATLDRYMAQAEAASKDPAEQLVAFFRIFEQAADRMVGEASGCLYASFIYERGPLVTAENDVIRASFEEWGERLLEKFEAAARTRPALAAQDLSSLADLAVIYFEGAFILVRATGDPSRMRRQLALLRSHMEMLLSV